MHGGDLASEAVQAAAVTVQAAHLDDLARCKMIYEKKEEKAKTKRKK